MKEAYGGGGIKLHLGCGRNVFAGWVNIDNSPSVLLARMPLAKKVLCRIGILPREHLEMVWPKEVVWMDASRGLPYSSGSVDKIYSSHFLEHLEKKRGEKVLFESFRVLKKGGILRLVVPDLAFHARRYLEQLSRNTPACRDPHDELLMNIYGGYLERKRFGAKHRYMYDWPTLQALLRQIGFGRVELNEYQKGLDAEMCSMDSRPEDSIHIDAVK